MEQSRQTGIITTSQHQSESLSSFRCLHKAISRPLVTNEMIPQDFVISIRFLGVNCNFSIKRVPSDPMFGAMFQPPFASTDSQAECRLGNSRSASIVSLLIPGSGIPSGQWRLRRMEARLWRCRPRRCASKVDLEQLRMNFTSLIDSANVY